MSGEPPTDASERKLEELEARVAVLVAAVAAGIPRQAAKPAADYPFLEGLQGDDLLAARTLIEENAALRARVESLESNIEERDYRIKHLKENVERLVTAAFAAAA
jgi:BMFP domain-containing protein YqiC